MRLFYYIKSTLKAMVASGAITILYFIGFPIILASFMGFVQNTAHDSALKLKPLNIHIVDQDNTEMSKKLEDFLKSEEMKEVVNIVDSKPEAEVIIQKGYEKNLLSLNKGEVIINKKEEGLTYSTNTLKIVLDKYHQSIYVQMTASVLVVSIVKFITTLFGAKYGKVFGMVIFILQIAGGELFTGKESLVALFTPTHYLNNAFLMYNLNGSLNDAGKWILMILAASAILFSIAVIKESLRDRRKLWV